MDRIYSFVSRRGGHLTGHASGTRPAYRSGSGAAGGGGAAPAGLRQPRVLAARDRGARMAGWVAPSRSESRARSLAAQSQMKIEFDAAEFRWYGIDPRAYKFSAGDHRGMGWRGVTRFTLGRPPAVPSRLELRYFELEPGGYSSLEKHTHLHLIVALRGKGKALVGGDVYGFEPFDLVY